MFGIDDTMIRASGRFVVSRFIASVKLVWKLATEVIAASLEVQTSLAPISIRTRSGLPATAVCAWPVGPASPATLAPVTASLPRTGLDCTAAELSTLTRAR